MGAPESRGNTVVFVTPSTATTSGGAVDAEADFTTTSGSPNGTLTITLKNFESDPGSVAQAISAFSFTLGTGNLTGSSSNSLTVSVPLVTIDNNGNTTFSTGQAGYVYSSTSSTGLLDVLSGPGHAGPANLIIGPSPYPNHKDSIAGNSPHNPFIDQTATFTITGPNITAATTVTAATFQFGTTEGNDQVTGTIQNITPQSVPEPATFVGAAFAVVASLAYGWRRKRVAA
jgi:hypothetical protein